MASSSLRKLTLLVWKNFILQIRRPIGTAVEIILPVIFLALLILARVKVKRTEECQETFNKISIPNANLFDYSKRLFNGTKIKAERPLKLGYYPNDDKTKTLLQSALKDLNASIVLSDKTLTSLEEVINEAKEYEGKYIGVVSFKKVLNEEWPSNIEYSIHMHHTTGRLYGYRRMSWNTKRVYPDYVPPGASSRHYYQSPFITLQYYIDSAIIQMRSGNTTDGAAKYIQQFPYPIYTQDNFILLIVFLIPLIMILAYMYTAQSIVKELVSEKEFRLKESMKMMGLPNWIHWTAWFIKIFIGFLFIIILQTLLLKGGKIFEFSHGGVIFVTLLIYILASIFFLFAVSVFFTNATRAMFGASLLWFISFAPYLGIQNPDKYDTLTRGAKFGCCILPNTCLGIIIQIISRYEGEQIGVNWDNIYDPVTIYDNFALSSALGMLVVDCLIFIFLTWYIENVRPGKYGVPKPFYFPFQHSYWCGPSVSHGDGSVELVLDDNFEQEPTGLKVGVSIQNLRKVYKGLSKKTKKVAVDNLSLNIYQGQITALLGHNGAGKTTTLSMLNGLFTPTSGSATVNGRSILTDMDAIRDSIGLCPQHNVLFDRLTVQEHLEFFSALKGTPKAIAKEEITRLIVDIQLVDKTHEKSDTLSGGMKRKLSCAIALLGGSETVFLDEPTSGMDPYARRATWDILQRYRGNRTIILTTHFMDEADHLGDRIAIMAEGKVRCCGSSLFLKKRFGVGYHLTLVKSPEFKEKKIISLINSHIPTAKMVGNVAAEMSYILSEDTSKNFKQLFEKLEDNTGDYGVTNFGISVTTLEEVFLKVSEKALFDDDADENGCGDDTARLNPKIDSLETGIENQVKQTGFGLRASQFKAMFIKRVLHSIRKRKMLFQQIIMPVLWLTLGLALSQSQGTQLDDPPRKLTLQMLKGKSDDISALFSSTSMNTDPMKKMAQLYYSSVDVQFEDKSDLVKNIRDKNQGDDVNVLYSKDPYSGKLTTNNKTACCSYNYLVLNKKCLQYSAIKNDGYLQKKRANYSWKLTTTCPDHGKCLQRLRTRLPPVNTSYLQEYVLEDSEHKLKKYFTEKVAGLTVDDNIDSPIVWYSNQAFHTLPSAFSAVSNIILKTKTKKSYGIVTTNHPLPRSSREQSELATQNWGNLTLMIFVIIGICNLAASFITFLVKEKMNKAKHVQFVSGVNPLCYWGATYCWDIINFVVPAIGFLIMFAIFNLEDYRGELGSVLFITLLYGLSVLPFVYLLSFLFSSHLVAYGFTSMFVRIISLAMYIAVMVCNLSFVDEKEAANIMHHVFLLFPTYGYPKALGDIATNVGQRKSCLKNAITQMSCDRVAKEQGFVLYTEETLAWESPGIGVHCVYMVLEALVYFSLVILIEVGSGCNASYLLGRLISSNSNKIYAGGVLEDSDVLAEREKVQAMQGDGISNNALVVKDLTKVYRTTGMVAVDHLNVAIPKAECFGLLGVNGAGKTTTFGMLTGELGMTEGQAYIHGHNLQTDLRKVQQIIGYCPQFDALVETLTGREMLRMFAQLRGIPNHLIKDVVANAVERFNLKKYADKLCGTYSGGNKRKLSTAIALVGNPAVIFLDEPTSGMDPGARRHLWDTLSSILNTGKSIILTSHSMEECEALCTRLVIMVNGKFKCIGSIQHLKSRFGQGYTVMLKINGRYNNNNNNDVQVTNPGYNQDEPVVEVQPSVESVKEFMNNQFPGSFLQEEHQGLLQYQIVNSEIRLSQMFGILEEHAPYFGIADYSVSQTSLEQVFINFAKEQNSEDRLKKKSFFSCTCC